METSARTEELKIARSIREHVGMGALFAVAARNFRSGDIAPTPGATPLRSLVFNTTILPMTKAGKRSTAPRTMQAVVSRNATGLHDVRVTYHQRGDKEGLKAPVVHYEATNVPAESLEVLVLSLDYDGETVTNPRYY